MADVCSVCNTSAGTNGQNVTLFNGLCFLCNDPNCVTCSADLECGQCLNSSFSVSPSGLCVICADINCVSCANSTSACLTCINSLYVVLGNGTCFAQSCTINNCTTCSNNTDGVVICTNCEAGMTPFNAGCVLCEVDNCLQCSSTNECFAC